jgi:hypothetical protein
MRRETAGPYVRGSEDSWNLTKESESRYSRLLTATGGGEDRKPSVNSTDGTDCGSLAVRTFYAGGAILSAQCDGLFKEVN